MGFSSKWHFLSEISASNTISVTRGVDVLFVNILLLISYTDSLQWTVLRFSRKFSQSFFFSQSKNMFLAIIFSTFILENYTWWRNILSVTIYQLQIQAYWPLKGLQSKIRCHSDSSRCIAPQRRLLQSVVYPF